MLVSGMCERRQVRHIYIFFITLEKVQISKARPEALKFFFFFSALYWWHLREEEKREI